MAIQYDNPLDRTFHALGDETRRTILATLATEGECSAGELVNLFQSAQPTISKHIKVLEKAGLVRRRIDGRTHCFRLEAGSLHEAETWINRHRKFWTGTLDRLGEHLETQPAESAEDQPKKGRPGKGRPGKGRQ